MTPCSFAGILPASQPRRPRIFSVVRTSNLALLCSFCYLELYCSLSKQWHKLTNEPYLDTVWFIAEECADRRDSVTLRACKRVYCSTSSVSIVTGLWAGRPGFDSWQGLEFIFLANAFRRGLQPNHPPIQRELRVFFLRGKSSRGMKLTADHHLVPRSRMRGAIRPLPPTSSCRGD